MSLPSMLEGGSLLLLVLALGSIEVLLGLVILRKDTRRWYCWR